MYKERVKAELRESILNLMVCIIGLIALIFIGFTQDEFTAVMCAGFGIGAITLIASFVTEIMDKLESLRD